MALDTAPKLVRKRVLAAKLETTTGTAIALDATNATIPVFNPTSRLQIPIVDREQQGGSLSPIAQAVGARSGAIEWESELVGNGSAGDVDWLDWAQACGMALNAGVLTPLTSPTQSLTVAHYQDGRLKRFAGCMGNVSFLLTGGEKGRCRWSMMGVPQAPSDTSILAPTYHTTVAPRVGATTFTIGGTVFRVDAVEIDLGNVVIMREDILGVDAASEATGYRAAYITDRRPVIRVSAEAVPLATKDWFDIHRDGTLIAFACTVGSASNNTFAFAAPKVQLISPPEDGDRNGMLTDALEFLCTRNTDAGEDELSITLT